MVGTRSALVATAVVGVCYMTATLVQFELSARVCPPGATATVFTSLMALSNLSILAATWTGGRVYEAVEELWGRTAAFQVLIFLGAATTALAAVVIPFFPRTLLDRGDRTEGKTDPNPSGS